MMYGMAVIGLITVLSDGKVMWYEATILVSAYVLYITGKLPRNPRAVLLTAFLNQTGSALIKAMEFTVGFSFGHVSNYSRYLMVSEKCARFAQ